MTIDTDYGSEPIDELEKAHQEIEGIDGKELRYSDMEKLEVSHSSGTKKSDAPSDEQKTLLVEGTTELSFSEIADKVEKFLPNTRQVLKIMLAIAHSGYRRNKTMLWMLLVGNPSSGKTELVELISKSPHVFSTDSFTMNAFISGERVKGRQKIHDLLSNLDNKCFVIKDWTTLFTLHREATLKAVGDLVGIYDGTFAKFSPARGNIVYKSNFSHLGCITPATLNKHTQYLNMVGARFVFYMIPELNQEQENKSFETIFSDRKRGRTKNQLTELVTRFLNKLNNSNKRIVEFNQDVQSYLVIASRFIARARGIVILQTSSFKNDEGQTVTYYEPLDIQIEQPWRAVQQLMSLLNYLVLVEEKSEVGSEELQIIKEVTLSSMPANRSRAIRVFQEVHGEITAKQLADGSDKSLKTARRLLDELTHLGILDKEKGLGTIAAAYTLKKDFKDFIVLDPPTYLSHKHKNVEPNETVENMSQSELERIFS